MANYLSFAGGIPLSDTESSDSEEELNVSDLALEEEPIIQFNNPSNATESLATAPIPALELFRKHPWDVTSDEEELIEGSGLFVKRLHITGCPDSRKWILKNMNPTSFQNPDVQDQYIESMHLPLDVDWWMEHSKDNLLNAILGHILEV